MNSEMERILGPDAVESERQIPGTRPGESNSVRYVSLAPGETPSAVYTTVVRAIEPPLVTSGGAMLEGCLVTVPDVGQTAFYPLVFNGDLAAWQQQIEQGAHRLGRLSAAIVGSEIVLSDGRTFRLNDCRIEFD